MANMISIKALLDEKLNSSAACGTLSKPTNAHGAMATMEIIAANAVVSDVNNGCRFSKLRSEERRVGKECRSRWSRGESKKEDKIDKGYRKCAEDTTDIDAKIR